MTTYIFIPKLLLIYLKDCIYIYIFHMYVYILYIIWDQTAMLFCSLIFLDNHYFCVLISIYLINRFKFHLNYHKPVFNQAQMLHYFNVIFTSFNLAQCLLLFLLFVWFSFYFKDLVNRLGWFSCRMIYLICLIVSLNYLIAY